MAPLLKTKVSFIPSLKLTYPLKIDPWKRRFRLETIIFRCYVSFRECNLFLKSFRRTWLTTSFLPLSQPWLSILKHIHMSRAPHPRRFFCSPFHGPTQKVSPSGLALQQLWEENDYCIRNTLCMYIVMALQFPRKALWSCLI